MTRTRIIAVMAALPTGAWAQCEVWMPPGTPPGFNEDVGAMVFWDADGAGPGSPDLVVGGGFTSAGGNPVRDVARWTGAAWTQVGPTFSSTVFALTTWDADGAGPLPEALVVGGNFTTAVQPNPTLNRIALWTPGATSWQALGTGMSSYVAALTSWDPDADGPQLPLLIAGGLFQTAGGVPANRIAAWNGTAWQSVGGSVDGLQVHCLTTWDPDGDGPLVPQLIATGSLQSAGGVPADRIARWDGKAWHGFTAPGPSGVNGIITTAISWDPDGSGPFPGILVIGGQFTHIAGTMMNGIAFWGGSGWEPMDVGLRAAIGQAGSATTLACWDADGAGPDYTDLIVGGSFSIAGEVPAKNVARWDGIAWRSLGSGVSALVRTAAQWDQDGPGPLSPRLLVGGDFTTAGGLAALRLAAYGCPPPPPCYPDCDGGGTLTIADFACFQAKFGASDPYADCDQSGALTIADFGCFQTKFVTGCP